jgi:hypothetical protein
MDAAHVVDRIATATDRKPRSSKQGTMTSLQLAKKARELAISNKPARLYKSIMRCVDSTGRVL